MRSLPTPVLALTLAFVWPSAGRAQAPECFPTCRSGFTCHEGECVSLCNPPCPFGQVCTDEATCVEDPLGGPAPMPAEAPALSSDPFHEPDEETVVSPGAEAPRLDTGQGAPIGTPTTALKTRRGRASPRVVVAFHLRAGGDAHAVRGDGSFTSGIGDSEVDPGGGAATRLELYLTDSFSIAFPAVFFTAMHYSEVACMYCSGTPSLFLFDFDVMPRARVLLDLGEASLLELYLGVPFGLSLFARNEGYGDEVGWNIGALLGAELFFGSPVGVMLEAGYSRATAYSGEPFDMRRFMMSVGMSFALLDR